MQVFQLPISDCPHHNDCHSCTASNDPLCGWCVLEEKCSTRSSCRSHILPHRWVQVTPLCISQVVLVADRLSIEDQLSVSSTHITVLRVYNSHEEQFEFYSYCLLKFHFCIIGPALQIKFQTIPSTSVFPTIRRNETYNCLFTNAIIGLMFNLSIFESGCVMNGTDLHSFSHICK